MIGIDLFAGAGGMSLGAIQAGIDVVLAVEKDEYAAATYRNNQPACKIFNDDIRSFSSYRIKRIPKPKNEATVVFGGPPCQGFSYSNTRTRRTDNKDNWLFEEFVRFVRVWQPDWIVFENVRGIVNTAGGVFLDEIVEQFDKLKYTLTYDILNSKNHGVPQDRGRFFLVGSKNGVSVDLPKGSTAKTLSVRDAISDLPKLSNGASVSTMPYSKCKPSKYAKKLRNGLKQSSNHLVTRNADKIVKRYKFVSPGGNWQDIPARLMRNYTDRSRCHTGIYHRLRPDAPSIVIGNYRKNMLIHPEQDRGLSVREAARIQSFPDSYNFMGSIGYQQQQVGNSVPPLLAKAVFDSILSQAGGAK